MLTIENLRGWINAAGLVLFAPRPQIAVPAPSLVEAVLGETNANPTIDQIAEARSLLARLVAEGLAVPLNLLGPGPATVHAGAPGDTPDFVASTAVFSYVFTLRGDKAWKQPPATTGAFKVSQLALATHEALSRRGPLSAYDLTTEVGKEVTEAAVLRALGELWTHMRVVPLAQTDGRAVWELTSARFTKQIKAGANAGQPSALSALISLYLGQAVVAAEDEIESFLSPLAPRSRIRDVVHALLSARQLETVAIEGRTMLHVAGALPAFAAAPKAEANGAVAEIAVEVTATEELGGEAAQRITKFVPKPRKIGTGYLARAKPSPFAAKGAAKAFGAKSGLKPGFKDRADSGFKAGFKKDRPVTDREKRPFSRPAAGGFDKPWNEERARRISAPRQATGERHEAAGAPRKTFSKPGTFGRKREGFAAQGAEGRLPRREFTPRNDEAYERSKLRTGRGERPEFGVRRAAGSYAPRAGADRAGRDRRAREEDGGYSAPKSYAPRAARDGKFAGKPEYSKGKSAGRPNSGKPRDGQDRGPEGAGGKRVYRKFDAPRERGSRPIAADRPAQTTERSTRSSAVDARKPAKEFAPRKFGGKPSERAGGYSGKSKSGGGFGGKKTFAKSDKPFSGKLPSTFAKFADNKKPFGKRAPGRKFKPSQGESS